jgi:hypothetical protein
VRRVEKQGSEARWERREVRPREKSSVVGLEGEEEAEGDEEVAGPRER